MEQQVTITGLTLFITVLLSAVTLLIPRKYILLPYVLGACWVPADQCIIISGLNFYVLQILVLMGILRLWGRGEIVVIRWNRFDKLFLVWVVAGTIIYMLRWMTAGAFVYKCGRMLEWCGLYWMFRQSIRSWGDLRLTYTMLALCALAMAPFVALEWATGVNPFTPLGRVVTYIREGGYRCQATFPHSIIMGLFWATLVPLFVGFARQGHKPLFWAATVASVFMILTTNSSTPILTLVIVGVVLMAYRWRQYTRPAAWAAAAMLCALHVVMAAPVWHLISRISVVSGSTGWHRYHLIDRAIHFIPEWVLLGTRSTAHWGWGLEDVTNQYVLEGVRGGGLGLALFLAMVFIGGRVFLRLSLRPREKGESYLAWCGFVTIIAHAMSFFGVSYFGQISMIWYLLLASVGLFYDPVHQSERVRRPAVAAGLQQV